MPAPEKPAAQAELLTAVEIGGAGRGISPGIQPYTGGNTPGLLDPAYAPGQSLVFPIATFDSLSLPSGFAVNPGTDLTSLFTINLNGWQGTHPSPGDLAVKVNDNSSGINLVVVPEPGAIALAALGLGLAGYALRRRRAA